MAEATPIVLNGAFRGQSHLSQGSPYLPNRRRSARKHASIPAPAARSHLTVDHIRTPPLQRSKHSVDTKPSVSIPIGIIITDSSGHSTSVSKSVPLNHKVSSAGNGCSSSRSVSPKSHLPVKRLGSGYNRTPRTSSLTGQSPGSPLYLRIVSGSEQTPPPPYDQLYDVESTESIQCPFLVVEGAARKEKKRSLRSRLLRHLTGKKAAQLAGTTPDPAGCQEAQNGCDVVMSNNGQLLFVPKDNNSVPFPTGSRLKLDGCSIRLNIPDDSQLLSNFHRLSNVDLSTFLGSQELTKDRAGLRFPISSLQSDGIKDNQLTQLSTVHEDVEEEDAPICIVDRASNITNISVLPPLSSDSCYTSSVANRENLFTNTKIGLSDTRGLNGDCKRSDPSSNYKFADFGSNCWSHESVVPVSSTSTPSYVKFTEVTSDKAIRGIANLGSIPKTSSSALSLHERKCRSRSAGSRTKTRIEINDSKQTKSFTLNLKPGVYKLKLNFPSRKKSDRCQTIDITVPPVPTDKSTEIPGQPPPFPEPLYYETSTKASLPQRFVEFLKPSAFNSKNVSKIDSKATLFHPSVDGKRSKITVVSSSDKRQFLIHDSSFDSKQRSSVSRSDKKERFRWAPFPCIQANSSGAEEVLSEGSGCDASWQGYEGVEHLKRRAGCQSVGGFNNDADGILCCGCKACQNCTGSFQPEVCYFSDDVTCDGSSESCALCNSENFYAKADLPSKPVVKCDSIHQSQKDLQKHWAEDEKFLKKIVNEYFMDPLSSSDCSTDTCGDRVDTSDNDSELSLCPNAFCGLVAGQVFVRRSEESVIKPITKFEEATLLENSLDESVYCDTDETISSLFTDESLGYDADIDDSFYRRSANDSFSEATCVFVRPDDTNYLGSSCLTKLSRRVIGLVGELGKISELHLNDVLSRPTVKGTRGEVDGVPLARETTTCRALAATPTAALRPPSNEGAEASSPTVDTVAASDVALDVGSVCPVSLNVDHQSWLECCADRGICATGLTENSAENENSKVCSVSSDSFGTGLRRITPLKLDTFDYSSLQFNCPLLLTTSSGESLCSNCRDNRSTASPSSSFSDTLENVCCTLGNGQGSSGDDLLTCQACCNGLIFERSSGYRSFEKFDLEATLKSLRQLEEDQTTCSTLSDSVFEEDSHSCYSDEGRPGLNNMSVNFGPSQTYYNTAFYNCSSNGLSDSSSSSNAYVNVQDKFSPRADVCKSSSTASDVSTRSKLEKYDESSYETYDFGNSLRVSDNNARLSSTVPEPSFGVVHMSSESSDDTKNISKASGFKPGRKRFAKAFQRAVVHVPISAPLSVETGNVTESVKSEFLIDRPCTKIANIDSKMTNSLNKTCISEYKFGDNADITATIESSSSENDSHKPVKAKKNKKSKSRKYFSGILDVLGNAAPLFRSSLVGSTSSNDSEAGIKCRKASLDSTCDEEKVQENSVQVNVSSSLVSETDSKCALNSGGGKNASSNIDLTDWRAAYLDHIGCDSDSLHRFANDVALPTRSNNSTDCPTNSSLSKPHVGLKKNSDEMSRVVQDEGSALYENVGFHKNLKKVSRFDVEMNDCETIDPTNVTTTATITLNSSNRSDCLDDEDKLSRTTNLPDSCTVSASISLKNLIYEDWCSAVGDNAPLNIDSGAEDTTEERPCSPQSVQSDSSSFYYTAGANTVYEAVKKVRNSLAQEFYHENIYEPSECNTDLDSMDDVTYLTKTDNSNILKNNSALTNQTCEESSLHSSDDSDLVEQFTALHKKYFGKTALLQNNVGVEDNCTFSVDHAEASVRAEPCLVLCEDSMDCPNSLSCTLSDNSVLCNNCNVGKSDKSKYFSKFFHSDKDSQSEASEVDKRTSGFWTTGTGVDADEESCADNSESASSDFKKMKGSFCQHSISIPMSTYPPLSNSRNANCARNTYCSAYENCGTNTCFCRPCSVSNWCSLHASSTNYPCFAYENTCNCFTEDKPSVEILRSVQPNGLPCNENVNMIIPENIEENCGGSVHDDSDSCLENKSENAALESDLSMSCDSVDIDECFGLDPKQNLERNEDVSVDYLQVPNNIYLAKNDPTSSPVPRSNSVSLLDDVISCLNQKWTTSASAPGSPGSLTSRQPVAEAKIPTSEQSRACRSSRAGKPPVSPGSRTRDGSGAAGSAYRSGSRPQSIRRRSRSASAGAKILAGCAARPASLIGLPRPSSLGHVPINSRRSSQESLCSTSPLGSFDDLAPRPRW